MKEFALHFWGEKNDGFDVLYQNYKTNIQTSKELSHLFEERCVLEEYCYKSFLKLAKTTSGHYLNNSYSSFSPIWHILQESMEKISNMNLVFLHSLQEAVKDIHKYTDEQNKQYKYVKDEESSTSKSIEAFVTVKNNVIKIQDLYHQKFLEAQKSHPESDNISTKEREKIEAKMDKLKEEYKNSINKYNGSCDAYIKNMLISCQKFQDYEVYHLTKMKSFVTNYADILFNTSASMSQMVNDLKTALDQTAIENMIELFVTKKQTGTQLPKHYEPSLDIANSVIFNNNNDKIISPSSNSNASNNSKNLPASMSSQTSTSFLREGFFRAIKKNHKKKRLDLANSTLSQSNISPLNTNEFPTDGVYGYSEYPNSNTTLVDKEGYSIKPTETTNSKATISSSSDSETDNDEEESTNKMRIEIKPVQYMMSSQLSLEELKKSVDKLVISPQLTGQTYRSRQSRMKNKYLTRCKSEDLDIQDPSSFVSPSKFDEKYGRYDQRPANSTTIQRYFDEQTLHENPSNEDDNRSFNSLASQRLNLPLGHIHENTATESDSSCFGSRSHSPLSFASSSAWEDTNSEIYASHRSSGKMRVGFWCREKISRINGKAIINGDIKLIFPSKLKFALSETPMPPLCLNVKFVEGFDITKQNDSIINSSSNPEANNLLLNFDTCALEDSIKSFKPQLIKHASWDNRNGLTSGKFNVLDVINYQKCQIYDLPSCNLAPLTLSCTWRHNLASRTIELRVLYSLNKDFFCAVDHNSASNNTNNSDKFYGNGNNSNGQIVLRDVEIGAYLSVSGDAFRIQSKPHSLWDPKSKKLYWKLKDLALNLANNGTEENVGSLRAKYEYHLSDQNERGKNESVNIDIRDLKKQIVYAKFHCKGYLLSGVELAPVGINDSLFKFSVKRSFSSGKYLANCK